MIVKIGVSQCFISCVLKSSKCVWTPYPAASPAGVSHRLTCQVFCSNKHHHAAQDVEAHGGAAEDGAFTCGEGKQAKMLQHHHQKGVSVTSVTASLTVSTAGWFGRLPVHGPLHGLLPASVATLTLCSGKTHPEGRRGHLVWHIRRLWLKIFIYWWFLCAL